MADEQDRQHSADNPFAKQGTHSPDNPFAQKRRAGDKPKGYRTPEQIRRLNKADQDEARDADEADTYGDRLGSMAERAASALPGGSTALTATRNITKRIIGEPETWEASAQANAEGAEEGGKNAPGVNVPVLGGRITLADLPAGAAGFRALLRAAPGLGVVKAGGAMAGLTRALDPRSESLASRATGTAINTAIGAGVPLALKGAGATIAKAGELAGKMPYIQNLRKVVRSKNSGDRAVSIDEAMKRMDARNYGAAEGEATSTPAIREVLAKDPKVAEIAKEIKADADYQGVTMTDAQSLMAAYRRLSSQQRRAAATLKRAESGEQGYDPKLSEGTIANLKTAKGRVLAAAEAPDEAGVAGIPSLRRAIQSKAKGEGARDAFEEGKDMADRIAMGRNVKGGKLLQQSPAAWERTIKGYSPQEARRALQGVLGHIKEIPEFTSQPLSAFGTVPSAVRTGLAVTRLTPYISLLEKQMGKTRAPNVLERTPGAFSDLLTSLIGKP